MYLFLLNRSKSSHVSGAGFIALASDNSLDTSEDKNCIQFYNVLLVQILSSNELNQTFMSRVGQIDKIHFYQYSYLLFAVHLLSPFLWNKDVPDDYQLANTVRVSLYPSTQQQHLFRAEGVGNYQPPNCTFETNSLFIYSFFIDCEDGYFWFDPLIVIFSLTFSI